MAALDYLLCALTATICARLLFSAWRTSRSRILLWSTLCFAGLAADNLLLVLDKLVFTQIDLSPYRGLLAAISLSILVFGLIWDADE